jgi:hypothetical protein
MSEVPSNLIPTRITQLPYAPVASEESLLVIAYDGNTGVTNGGTGTAYGADGGTF